MSGNPYYSSTYIRKTRDRLYRILGRQPSIEEIQSQIIGLNNEELVNLLEHEIINNLLLVAGKRNLMREDICSECQKWGFDDNELDKITKWAVEAGLFETWSHPYSTESRLEKNEKKSLQKVVYPTLEELTDVKKRIPDFKETVVVGKNEVIRNFLPETLDEIKEDLVKHRQSHEMITAGDFEFELRVWNVPKVYVV